MRLVDHAPPAVRRTTRIPSDTDPGTRTGAFEVTPRSRLGVNVMLEMLRDLVAHKGYADAALLHAVRENSAAMSDPKIRELLHHILLANRFWLCAILDVPFVLELESRDSSSFGELVQRYAGVHTRESAWLRTATDADLARVLDHPDIPGRSCALSQALTQVCLHSHGHRTQCARLLRNHGGVPPMTDFIVWLATRPAPAWE